MGASESTSDYPLPDDSVFNTRVLAIKALYLLPGPNGMRLESKQAIEGYMRTGVKYQLKDVDKIHIERLNNTRSSIYRLEKDLWLFIHRQEVGDEHKDTHTMMFTWKELIPQILRFGLPIIAIKAVLENDTVKIWNCGDFVSEAQRPKCDAIISRDTAIYKLQKKYRDRKMVKSIRGVGKGRQVKFELELLPERKTFPGGIEYQLAKESFEDTRPYLREEKQPRKFKTSTLFPMSYERSARPRDMESPDIIYKEEKFESERGSSLNLDLYNKNFDKFSTYTNEMLKDVLVSQAGMTIESVRAIEDELRADLAGVPEDVIEKILNQTLVDEASRLLS